MESLLHVRRSTSDCSEASLTHQPLRLLLISLLRQVPRARSAEPEQHVEHRPRHAAAKATGFTWSTPGSGPDAVFQARLQSRSLSLFSLLLGCVKGRARSERREVSPKRCFAPARLRSLVIETGGNQPMGVIKKYWEKRKRQWSWTTCCHYPSLNDRNHSLYFLELPCQLLETPGF